MTEYKLTNKAVEDLSSIWEYTFEKWSEKQADNYYNMLIDNFQNIANNPDLGKIYEGIATELYGFKANRHIIFYRKLINKAIEITRVLHEQMDLKNRLKE